jgi:hypothetical protein
MHGDCESICMHIENKSTTSSSQQEANSLNDIALYYDLENTLGYGSISPVELAEGMRGLHMQCTMAELCS